MLFQRGCAMESELKSILILKIMIVMWGNKVHATKNKIKKTNGYFINFQACPHAKYKTK